MREPSSICPKPEPSSSRNEISRSGRPVAGLGGQPADLERRADAERAVVLAAVAVRVAMRADAEGGRIRRDVGGDQRADRVLPDGEADLLELGREVRERVAVDVGVGVAADGAVAERVVRAREGLDVALDARPRALPVDAFRHGSLLMSDVCGRVYVRASNAGRGRRATANQRVGTSSQNAIHGPSAGLAAARCSEWSDVFQRGLDRTPMRSVDTPVQGVYKRILIADRPSRRARAWNTKGR